MLRKNFTLFSTGDRELMNTHVELQKKLASFCIDLDIKTGHLFYTHDFKPLSLNYELLFVRHGETYGNCGQCSPTGEIDYTLVKKGIKNRDHRIYQGNVDNEINQLTEHGKQQAAEVADKLENHYLKNNWEPDIIFISPLKRAKDTALPFIKRHRFEDKCIFHEGIKEMSFGSWDNRRICDMQTDDPCHLFYREQNALVKNNGVNNAGIQQNAENFCDVLLRAYAMLIELNENHPGKKILMFSHAIFGAACSILLGKGQKIEDGEYIAFDGKRKDGTYYSIPNATPILLTAEYPKYYLQNQASPINLI